MNVPYTTRVTRFDDERGWFMSSFNGQSASVNWKLQNTSFSHRNTLRGLHYQSPRSQVKLVTVIEGSITDVVLDIDPNSPTYGEWEIYQLSSSDSDLPNQIYIPNHYAHGFAVTSEKALVSYLTDELYRPEDEFSIHPLSPSLNIPWGIENPIMSVKDSEAKVWDIEESNSKS